MRPAKYRPGKLNGQRARDLARLGLDEYLRRQESYRNRSREGVAKKIKKGLHDEETQSGGDIEESLAATRAYFREREAMRAVSTG